MQLWLWVAWQAAAPTPAHPQQAQQLKQLTENTSTAASETASGDGAVADGKVYQIGICQLVQHDALDRATQGFEDASGESY